jgi:7,8-dihydropterin-6-yl-methyl-4-(beta-D-ribofuranosyl)aminobenzene 5'-phosphate synthase
MQTVKSVKVTTLADNVVYDSRLLGQFGFSAYLEIKDYKGKKHSIIFDAGRRKGALLYNIKTLKLDLSPLECIILSHGHFDHTSATVELIKRAKRKVQVIAHPNVFLPKYVVEKHRRRYIGAPRGERKTDILKAGGQVVETTRPVEIIPGVLTSGEIKRITPFEKITWKNMTVIDGKQVRDHVLDDQALFINIEKHGVLVLSGCAHAGIINTLKCALDVTKSKRLYGFIGGTHLIHPKEERLKETVRTLKEYDLQLISPAHCTGHKSIATINQAFPKAFVLNYAGRTIDTAKKLKNPVF